MLILTNQINQFKFTNSLKIIIVFTQFHSKYGEARAANH